MNLKICKARKDICEYCKDKIQCKGPKDDILILTANTVCFCVSKKHIILHGKASDNQLVDAIVENKNEDDREFLKYLLKNRNRRIIQ